MWQVISAQASGRLARARGPTGERLSEVARQWSP